MRLLFIDDDEDKRARVSAYLREKYGLEVARSARSLQTGVLAALQGDVDLILLDMTMRNFDRTLYDDGGRPHPFAGREILRQMRRAKIATPTIVITQFERFGERENRLTLEELKAILREQFPNYIDTVQYKTDIDGWKEKLSSILETLKVGATP